MGFHTSSIMIRRRSLKKVNIPVDFDIDDRDISDSWYDYDGEEWASVFSRGFAFGSYTVVGIIMYVLR